MRNGLVEIQKWNVLAQLFREQKLVFKSAKGWELTTDGLARVEVLAAAFDSEESREVVASGFAPTQSVLIVESNAHTMQLLEFIFGRAGYLVSKAANGRDAQDFISAQSATDLMVTALTLPYVSGYQVISHVKQNAAWMHVPIIVLSGKVLEADVVKALNLGANDYVTKPFRPRELLARAQRLIITYQALGKS